MVYRSGQFYNIIIICLCFSHIEANRLQPSRYQCFTWSDNFYKNNFKIDLSLHTLHSSGSYSLNVKQAAGLFNVRARGHTEHWTSAIKPIAGAFSHHRQSWRVMRLLFIKLLIHVKYLPYNMKIRKKLFLKDWLTYCRNINHTRTPYMLSFLSIHRKVVYNCAYNIYESSFSAIRPPIVKCF